MLRTSNYLTLSNTEKISRIVNLQDMRISLAKDAKTKRVGKRKKKSRKASFRCAMKEMFNSLSKDAQDFLLSGGK